MGGAGSGGHNKSWRGTAESYRRIDSVWLQKHCAQAAGWSGHITWTSAQGPSAPSETNFINVSGGRDELTLSYRFRDNGGPWQDVCERVAVDWSPRRHGGGQAYFLCPRCASRRRFLIGAGPRFLCTMCHGLVNASTREGEVDRVFRKLWKIKRRIGADLALEGRRGTRPKGMHRATYARLVKQVEMLERAATNECCRRLMQTRSRGWRSRARPGFWG